MLLDSPRFMPGDREHWRRMEALDARWCRTRSFARSVDRAQAALEAFAEAHRGRFYIGVSWGKDSVVVAHLAHTLGLTEPLVDVEVEGLRNPDCMLVRDAYLSRTGQRYDEIMIEAHRDADGIHATGTIERGFELACQRHGTAHVSGVRAMESWKRAARHRRWGESSPQTCAPLSAWTGEDVFAYLHLHDLPVHPAYAMTMGGRLDRSRLRVAWIGLTHGTGMGRREWEQTYYSDVLASQ